MSINIPPISKTTIPKEKIILGLDPGTSIMGYGLILVQYRKLRLLQFGVIKLGRYSTQELKLKKIFERTLNIIEEFNPDEVALEAPFFGKNIQSMLKLGRAQGVAMSAALSRSIPIFEYAPRKIKQSVAGNGNASKEQVAKMLMQIFSVMEMPNMLDATDALSVALCHYYQNERIVGKSNTWSSFLKKNPTREIGSNKIKNPNKLNP